MPIYPKANIALIPLDTGQDPAETMTTVVCHTAVSGQSSPGPAPVGGTEWHFYIDFDGTVSQRRDTTYQADAQYDANAFAISIESWDNGDPYNTPLTQAQIDAFIELLVWCIANHPIPAKVCDAWNSGGLGYHNMFERWNKSHHSCPTALRAGQFDQIVFPSVLSGAVVVPPPSAPAPAPPFQKPPMSNFPLAAGNWFGPPSSNPRNHSGYYSSSDAAAIKQIQTFLNWNRNAGLAVDGKYGTTSGGMGATGAAVKAFQRDASAIGFDTRGIDGLVGTATWNAMEFMSNA